MMMIKAQGMKELNFLITKSMNHKIHKLSNRNKGLSICYKFKKMWSEHKLIIKFLKTNSFKTKCNVFFFVTQYKTHRSAISSQ